MTHTPGPWQACKNGIVEGKSALVADVFAVEARSYDDETEGSEARANAALIAASPDLLEALEILTGLHDIDHEEIAACSCDTCNAHKIAFAAIAKARKTNA